MNRRQLLAGLAASPLAACGQREVHAAPPEIVEVRKIWDQGAHNAFTDLIRFRDRWWCSFREGDGHVGGDGKVRVLTSPDGQAWESAALIAERDVDLRDPKLSVTPDNRLMIVAGGSVYLGTKQLKGRQPRVIFSGDGRNWSPPRQVLGEWDWLWRVAWHDGTAYGVAYNTNAEAAEWNLRLCRSRDGERWETVAPLTVTGRPNETTVRVLKSGEMMALVRREAGGYGAWIGAARPPFEQWTWQRTDFRVGGPNFIQLPDGSLWAGMRHNSGAGPRTVVARLKREAIQPELSLPSSGDNSYPGLVWHDGLLWVSYYSSHEGKTSIYLAKVRLPAG